MNEKKYDDKFKINANLIMSPDKKRNVNNFFNYQHNIGEMTNIRNKNIDNSSNLSFDNDITLINSTNVDLLNDIRRGKRNMDILVRKLVDIHSEGKKELTNIAKEISSKITDLYEYLIDTINNQNKEKFKLEIEISNCIKENSELRKQIIILTNEIVKLEEIIRIENQNRLLTSSTDHSM